MRVKKNCDICTSCIEEYSTSCVRMGIEIPMLGVECNDTLDSVILKLSGINTIEGDCTDLQEKSTAVTTPTVALAQAGERLGLNFSCASQITNRRITYTVTNTATSTEVNYDLSALSNLPKNFSVLSIDVKATGGGGIISTSRSAKGIFNVKPNQFPVTVAVKVIVMSPCGQLLLEKLFALPSNAKTGTTVVVMDIEALFAQPEEGAITQSDFNKSVESELMVMKDKITTMSETDLGSDVLALTAAVADATSKIGNILDTPVVIPTCGGGTEAKSIKDILTKLTQDVCDIKVSLTSLNNDYLVLKNRVDNFPSTITS